MKILCTGGKGYLGSRLVPVLVERGHKVIALGKNDGDLVRYDIVAKLIDSSYDLVVHMAAQPGRVLGEILPRNTIESNVVTTANVARNCEHYGVRMCYVSTSEIYGRAFLTPSHSDYDGMCELGPIDEDEDGFPINLYGMTKLWGEEVSSLYAEKDLLIIRPSMAYGPGMMTGRGRAALPTMISNFLRNEPYIVHTDTARSWCYVDDLVRGMADVIEQGEGTYNVGRDDDLREMISIAHLVCHLLGTDPELIQLGLPDKTIRPVKDISMARLKALGWKPTIDLEEGIMRVANSLQVQV
jgi:nucleoside-diphosphate-sugar epimerase